MKKFLNMRNVIIVLVIFVAAVYVIFMRSRNPYNSKTCDMYYKIANKQVATMVISFEDSESKGRLTFSTDKERNKEVQIIDMYDYKDNNNRHIKSVIIRENDKTHTYQIDYDGRSYIDIGEADADKPIMDWANTLARMYSEGKYFTKKFEIIDGKKIYMETFPKLNYTFGYDGEELKYLKYKDGISGKDDTLYNVEITDIYIDESETKIPEGFTLNENVE